MGWEEVKLVQQKHLLWNLFDLGDSMGVMGLFLESGVLLKVQQLLENRFQKCQVLVLGVLA